MESFDSILDHIDAVHPELAETTAEIRARLDELHQVPEIDGKRVLGVQEGTQRLITDIRQGLAIAKRPLVVGIAGGTGSGKSTIARALREVFPFLTELPLDYFFLDPEVMKAREVPHWDHPDFNDLAIVNRAIKLLTGGHRIRISPYDKNTHRRRGTKDIEPSKLILVEGLYTLDPRIEVVDHSAYMLVSAAERMRRRIVRDVIVGKLEGRTFKTELEYLWGVVHQAHIDHVKSTMGRAKWVFLNEARRNVA